MRSKSSKYPDIHIPIEERLWLKFVCGIGMGLIILITLSVGDMNTPFLKGFSIACMIGPLTGLIIGTGINRYLNRRYRLRLKQARS